MSIDIVDIKWLPATVTHSLHFLNASANRGVFLLSNETARRARISARRRRSIIERLTPAKILASISSNRVGFLAWRSIA